MSDDATLPPRKPRTIRTGLAWLKAWAQAHPVWAAAIGGVLVGLTLPVVARWAF